MKFDFRILVLFILSFTVAAEPQNSPPPIPTSALEVQVYTKQSSENVAALNKAVEVVSDPVKALRPDHEDKKELPRDPTQMSGNFRQELKKMHATSGTNSNPGNNAPAANHLPTVELAAKIMGTNKSVMLRINGHVTQVVEGGQVSLIENQQVITVRVDKIDKHQVKVLVLPSNERLILQ